jgi:hypothetical protein
MDAKPALRDGLIEARSVVWSLHTSDERHRRAPARPLPEGFRAAELPALRLSMDRLVHKPH